MRAVRRWCGLAFLLVGCSAQPDAPVASPDAKIAASGDAGATDDAGAPVQPDPSPDLATPVPLPIVLVHGLAGWAKLGTLDYFYGVPDALRATGRKVYVPALDMFNGSEARGQRLLEVIAQARAETGAPRVVLIGHSQGGLDARWAIARAQGGVAALVTIGTPHRGTPIADLALGLTPGPAQAAASAVLGLVGGALDPSGMPNADLNASLTTLSVAHAAAFNAANPDVAGVAYYSIAGRSAGRDAASCPPSGPPFIQALDGTTDELDGLLLAPGGLLTIAELPSTAPNDGLLTVESARWGTFLGCIPADHLNEICQPNGGPFDCRALYLGLEAWLRQQGF